MSGRKDHASRLRRPAVGAAALALIRRFEGLRLRAYRDAVGVWTIGYGHTSMAGPPRVRPGMRITKAEAEAILRRDVERFADKVAAVIGPQALARLNDNQFGALVSFAYNVGLGNFRRSSVLRAVRDGRLDDVPRLLMRWTKARKHGRLVELRGLVRRRRAEGELFMAPPEETTAAQPSTAAAGPDVAPDRHPRPAQDGKAAPAHPPPDRQSTEKDHERTAAAPHRAAVSVAAAGGLLAVVALWIWRRRLMRIIRRLFAPLKGWRTFLFALLVAALGVAEATDWASIVPDGPAKGWWLLGISLTIAWLRVITTTPPGRARAAGHAVDDAPAAAE